MNQGYGRDSERKRKREYFVIEQKNKGGGEAKVSLNKQICFGPKISYVNYSYTVVQYVVL